MHLITLQRELYESNPGAPLALLEAFEESKRRGRERLRDLDTLAVMHPWIAAELDELKEPFAGFGGDPFVYGVGPNRRVLDALLDYSFEQGLSERRVAVEELFAPEDARLDACRDRRRAQAPRRLVPRNRLSGARAGR